jgi:tRNA modification GTPase
MTAPETIAAIATPRGKSALAIIRISGTKAFEVFARCIQEKDNFNKTPARFIKLFLFCDTKSKKPIDQITAIKYPSPHSFTGENMVEILCHGGPVIVREIMGVLLGAGAKAASRGEFTRRALENGKISLMKAEAIRGLIESTCESDLFCAQKLYGEQTHPLEQWRKEIIEFLAQLEAEIEFDEENFNSSTSWEEGKKKIEDFIDKLHKDIKKRERIHLLKKGLKVVIAGPVNAGKSTLFNLLVGYNRVIVHREPGTTRDTISEQIQIDGQDVQLIDTAGIRDTTHEIEQEGIKRSRVALKEANIVIWVTDAETRLGEEEVKELKANKEKNLICILNKIDINNGTEKVQALNTASIKSIPVSLKNNINIEKVFSSIEKKIHKIGEKSEMPELLFNERHEAIGKLLESQLRKAIAEWGRPEIAAHHIKKGLIHLEELFGHINAEEIMNTVFEKFCIGK